MIKVVCESCSKIYSLDPNIIKSESAKFTCKNCGHVNYLAKYLEKSQPVEEVEPEPQQFTGEIKKVAFSESLRFKVNIVLIPLIIIIMGAYTYYNFLNVKKDMNTDLKNASSIVATRLSNNLIEAFWALDSEILTESLKAEMLDKRIYAISIKDRDGKKTYMGFKRDNAWKLIENKASISGETIVDKKPMIKDKDEIGFVEVFFTDKFIKDEVNKSLKNLGLTALALVVFVSLAANFVIQRTIVTPIEKITDLANKISIGNLETKIPKESNDEIGVLAEAFDRMRISMTFAIKQLRKRQ